MTPKELTIRLNKLKKSLIKDDTMSKIGQSVVDTVKTRTRRGFGVDNDGDRATKFKGISESYKKQRKRLAKRGKLSSDTTASKSNLTQTGKMVDDINYATNKNGVTVFVKGNENRRKAKHQANTGRKFMNLSKGEIKAVKDMIQKSITDTIKKSGL